MLVDNKFRPTITGIHSTVECDTEEEARLEAAKLLQRFEER